MPDRFAQSAHARASGYVERTLRALHARLCRLTAGMAYEAARTIVLAEADAALRYLQFAEKAITEYTADAGEALNPPELQAHGSICLQLDYCLHGWASPYRVRMYIPDAPAGWL